MPSNERIRVILTHLNQDDVSTQDSENVDTIDGSIIRSTPLLNCKAAKFNATEDNLSPKSQVYEIKENVNEPNDDSVKRDKQIPDNTPTESDAQSTVELALPEKNEDKVQPQQNRRLNTVSEFLSSFEIPDKGFWTAEYINELDTVDILVQKYKELKLRIKIAYANPENKVYFDGYSKYHVQRYLLETLIGEGNIKASTSLDEIEKYIEAPNDTKVSLKINNLKHSMDKLFPDIFEFINCESKTNVEDFTPKFIQNLHKEVMANLIDKPGAYRTNWAAPSQEDWMFLVPEKISEKLDRLGKELRKELGGFEKELNDDAIVKRVKIVANFLTHFLQIHPFPNGNGRIARLLISWLMNDLTIVPVPLLASRSSRDTYLECLRDSRHKSPFVPANLARFVFESVIRTMRIVCVSLDI